MEGNGRHLAGEGGVAFRIGREMESALLRETQARNKAILQALPDLMFLLDENGVYVDYHARNPGDLYASPEQFLGKNMRDILPAEVSDLVAHKFEEAQSTGEPATLEYSLTINDAKRFFEARIVRCDDGRFLSIIRDITASKHAEVELKTAKGVIERIMATLPSLLFLYDYDEQRHICMNGSLKTILGYSDSEISKMGGDVFLRLVHPDDQLRLKAQLSDLRLARNGVVSHVIYRMRDRRQEWRWILAHYTVLDRDDEGSVKRAVGTATDITEHRRIQEELQSLSTRLLNVQDREIRKVAADLHEVIAQDLFAVTLNLKRLRQLAARSRSRDRSLFNALLAECETQCERSLQDVRSSSYSLYPPALHELGVVPTLRWYVEGFAKRSGIQVRLSVRGEVRSLPEEIETDLFRIVQQGLTNVAHHSGSNAAVRVNGSTTDVTFEIEGYGERWVAADFEGTPNLEYWPDLGLQEMRQRLRQLGGCLEIQSTRSGTLIVGNVPVCSEPEWVENAAAEGSRQKPSREIDDVKIDKTFARP